MPGSLPALLELRLGESGREALGFAVHVPHYLAQAEWAEGALAVLNAVVDHTGLNLPNDDLIAKAGANTREIASELSDNTEAAQLVQALEQQYDTFMEGKERPSLLATEASELPSAEELGAEFSSRSRHIDAEKNRLIAEYVEKHGRHPSTATIIKLRAQATLTTRPVSYTHLTLPTSDLG